MMRIVFYCITVIGWAITYFLYTYWSKVWGNVILFFLAPYTLIGMYDVIQKTSTILRLFPVIGHLRFMMEYIRPEIQQYFIANDRSEKPFSRELRNIVYQRAKNQLDTVPFGTQHNIEGVGYESCRHSMAVKDFPESETRVIIGGPQCKKSYKASILNISAMSFGSLSSHAIMALNKGAKMGGFYHNTGEGGLSDYHLQGGDLCWQIGTGYFGCRKADGGFDRKIFAEKAKLEIVKMIEIKISQGAKPSHGGILPQKKITKEIAAFRGVPMDRDCESPSTHKEFSSPEGLLKFLQSIRELSGGKPVGFKLCIGNKSEFMGICKAMLKTKILPDFITVDGSEGGTGAAPLEFINRLGMSSNEAVIFVHNCLVGIGLRKHIRIIASGKVATAFNIATKLSLGADICNAARSMMFALGCLQSLTCNNNNCPTGIATQSKYRYWALDVEDKAQRVYSFHKNTIKIFRELAGAMGVDELDSLTPDLISRIVSDSKSQSYAELYHYLKPGDLLKKNIHEAYASDWALAHAEEF